MPPPASPVTEKPSPDRHHSRFYAELQQLQPAILHETPKLPTPDPPPANEELQRHGTRRRALAKLRTRLDRRQLHSKAERPILGIKPQPKAAVGPSLSRRVGAFPTAIARYVTEPSPEALPWSSIGSSRPLSGIARRFGVRVGGALRERLDCVQSQAAAGHLPQLSSGPRCGCWLGVNGGLYLTLVGSTNLAPRRRHCRIPNPAGPWLVFSSQGKID
ncbi:hypothetical protein TGAM01_v204760 [Trichoderma gamsii]|uniref:Uncharacterized protein n=1 Tax=Trichoderma gamsii TaxID=398673 RepID=A0A2P4ZPT7_9HYPO|nr:hypothetical protein TGAM01_v204760 [Trichoderma gamsii]PON26284.1 hypothetical protein TGAM01_v204760 [Trichoderma gamsii]